jgi:hypothetical protein
MTSIFKKSLNKQYLGQVNIICPGRNKNDWQTVIDWRPQKWQKSS